MQVVEVEVVVNVLHQHLQELEEVVVEEMVVQVLLL
jgi:hypothetical protein